MPSAISKLFKTISVDDLGESHHSTTTTQKEGKPMTVESAIRYIAWLAEVLAKSEGELRYGAVIVNKDGVAETLRECVVSLAAHSLIICGEESSMH